MGKITRLKKERIVPLEMRVEMLEEHVAELVEWKDQVLDADYQTPPLSEELTDALSVLPPIMTRKEIKEDCKKLGATIDCSPEQLKEAPALSFPIEDIKPESVEIDVSGAKTLKEAQDAEETHADNESPAAKTVRGSGKRKRESAGTVKEASERTPERVKGEEIAKASEEK